MSLIQTSPAPTGKPSPISSTNRSPWGTTHALARGVSPYRSA